MQTPHHLGRPDRLGPGTSECHCRRHRRSRNGATSPGQAAHLPTRSAGRCRRPGRWPWRVAHPLYEVLTTRARDQGSRPPPSLLAETLGKTSRHRRPAGLLRRARSRHTPLRLIDPWQGASPTAATRGSSAPCSPPPSPPSAPTPSPGPTTSTNETRANRLGPGRSRPGPPPHPDPARHDPRWSPLRPPTYDPQPATKLPTAA